MPIVLWFITLVGGGVIGYAVGGAKQQPPPPRLL